MAVIDLNNIVRPKQNYNPSTQVKDVVTVQNIVYTDLHLDLKTSQNVGLGINAVAASDIQVDTDLEAIKNSIRNIFTTKKGQKLLNPDFGCSLEQYLFSPITQAYARAIGNEIMNGIAKYEPRISITDIIVTPYIDQNQYYIAVYYKILEINKQSILNIIAQLGGQVLI
jgi:phage baseplate assembly protein W